MRWFGRNQFQRFLKKPIYQRLKFENIARKTVSLFHRWVIGQRLNNVTRLDKYPYEKREATGILVFKAKPYYNQTWEDSKAKILREYITYLESNNISNQDDFPQWIEWAKKKADWYDPLIKGEDEILGYFKSNSG